MMVVGYTSVSSSMPPKISQKKTDFLLRADQISHDKDLGIVIARGNVKISDGIEIIEADTVTYNEKLNLVSASSHVRFYDKKGGITTGNYMEITEDLKNGFVEKVYVLTKDEERFAAEIVTKEGDLSTFRRGVYSPCEMCKTKPCKPPIWQLRASQIKKDDAEKMVYYRNVFLDIKGVPVFYFPYLNHPDPSVTRKDGLLMPFFGNSTSLGMIAGIPYYFSPNPSEAVIIRPIIMTKENAMLSGSYNRLFKKGSVSLSGSMIHTSNITGPENDETKNKERMHGHLIGSGLFDLDSNWRARAKIERTTSPTYFKKYYFVADESYINKNYLTSSLNVEGFYGKNYMSAEGLDFQNLRADVSNKTIPFVAPVLIGSYVTPPGLRGDYYDVRKYQIPGTQSNVNQGMGRLIPGAALTLKYPLINQFGRSKKLIVEPVVGVVTLPSGLNNSKYPNEDSQNFEFEAVHLMQPQRFAGFDLIDDGQRLNYGAHVNLYSKSKTLLQFFAGQSYSFSKENQFDPFCGVGKGFSDYVGRVVWSPLDNYRLAWYFRLGKKKLDPKKNTVSLTAGPPLFREGIGYTQIYRTLVGTQYVRREQISNR